MSNSVSPLIETSLMRSYKGSTSMHTISCNEGKYLKKHMTTDNERTQQFFMQS